MSRLIRDTRLETRNARQKLQARGKPYYRNIESGLHLGYRKSKSGGKWVVRWYSGSGKYKVETLGKSDDIQDADGISILSYNQAQESARKKAKILTYQSEGIELLDGPYTVSHALDEYLKWMEKHRKSAKDSRQRADLHIIPELGDIEVEKLTTLKIRNWLEGLVDKPAQLRSKKEDINFRDWDDNSETTRKRKSTANRIFTVLKAALNHAWKDGKISSDIAWRRVTPFHGVDSARIRFLNKNECVRLINASQEDFRDLVQAALLTGARYGELTSNIVSDFNPDSGTLLISQSKSNKSRQIILTNEGVKLFKTLVLGKSGDEYIFTKNGLPWTKSLQTRPMKQACVNAKIDPEISFHGLRHTYASLAIMNGVPLFVIAKNLGHRDTRMVEKHYGHLANSYMTQEIKKGVIEFGTVQNTNIKSIAS